MANTIVYVNDADYADYAEQMLQPMLAAVKPGGAARWIVVACAPHLTHDAGKWVPRGALKNWRGEWADKVFAQLTPLLQKGGGSVVTRLAATVLTDQTESLLKEFSDARVLDARRPKFGQDLKPVTAGQVQESRGAVGVAVALATAAVIAALD